ncbi:hypothetical protein JR316_0008052 [Psilocybe cubensis]|uniref:Uncharacterized protein n=2 Tax=Psilocybe cubensis TaxID=181762 RepID=A0ACB8GVA5_PSICU|nr:hypothetical protein JR316_0008052 [Psilocybe cubensis]KAH9479458.1 hypothetical protein JR316_0008052 [Psilocybe cubensis]
MDSKVSHSRTATSRPCDSDTYRLLPTELLEQILTEAWVSSMSPEERKKFVKTISRASKTWAATLARVCSRDVYIIEEELQFPKRIETDYSSFQLRRSLTRQLPLPSFALTTYGSFTQFERLRKRAMKDLLSTFRGLPYAPNLSKLSVEYFSQGTSSCSIIAFDVRVIRMEVEYNFVPDTPSWLLDELGLTGRGRLSKSSHTPWEIPDLDHISTSDSDASAFGDILRLCPHLEMPTTKTFGINLRILSSSDYVPQHSSIVHGPVSFPKFLGWISENDLKQHRNGCIPEGICGKSLGLVLDNPIYSRGRSQDLTNMIRNVGVFTQRSGSS